VKFIHSGVKFARSGIEFAHSGMELVHWGAVGSLGRLSSCRVDSIGIR
jgi:hypothetical protein